MLKPEDFNKAVTVWSEDDATCGDPEHETVWQAYKRLYGKNKVDGLGVQDYGDVVYHKMPDDVVVACSYPGNSTIYDFKEVDCERCGESGTGPLCRTCEDIEEVLKIREFQDSAHDLGHMPR